MYVWPDHFWHCTHGCVISVTFGPIVVWRIGTVDACMFTSIKSNETEIESSFTQVLDHF